MTSIRFENNAILLYRWSFMTWKKVSLLKSQYSQLIQKQNLTAYASRLTHWRKLLLFRQKAELFKKRVLLQKAMLRWEKKLERQRDFPLLGQFEIAERFFRIKLKARVFSYWYKIRMTTQSHRQLEQKSHDIYELNLIGRTITSWQMWLDKRAELNRLNLIATRFHSEVLLAKLCYGIWTKSVQLRNFHELRAISNELRQKFIIRTTLRKMKSSLKLQIMFKQQIEIADNYRKRKLMTLTMQSFLVNVENKKHKLRLKMIADQVYSQNLLSKTFATWKNNIEQTRKNNLVKGFRIKWLMRTAFIEWKLLTNSSLNKLNLADSYRVDKIISFAKIIFNAWQSFTLKSKENRCRVEKLQSLALDFQKRKFQLRVTRRIFINLDRYQKSAIRRKTLLQQNMEQICYISLKSKKQILMEWRKRAALKIENSKRWVMAKEFLDHKLLQRSYHRFRNVQKYRNTKLTMEKKAFQFSALVKVRMSLSRLREEFRKRQDQNIKTQKALCFLYQTVSWKYFKRWKEFHAQHKEKTLFYDQAFREHRTAHLDHWAAQSDIWARNLFHNRKVVLVKNYGEKYVYLARWTLSKWKNFAKRKVKTRASVNSRDLMLRNLPKIEKFDLINLDHSSKEIKFRPPKIPDFLANEIPIKCSDQSEISKLNSSSEFNSVNFEIMSEQTSPISQLSSASKQNLSEKVENYSLNETESELVEIFSRKVSEQTDQFPLYFIDESEYRKKLQNKNEVCTPNQDEQRIIDWTNLEHKSFRLEHLKQQSQSDDFVLINVKENHNDIYDESKDPPLHTNSSDQPHIHSLSHQIEFDQFPFLPPRTVLTQDEFEREELTNIWQSPNSFPEPIFNNQIARFNNQMERRLENSRGIEIPVLFTQKYSSCLLNAKKPKSPERTKKIRSPILECDLDCSSLSYFGQTLDQSRDDPWVMTSSSSPTHSTFTEIDEILDEEQIQECSK